MKKKSEIENEESNEEVLRFYDDMKYQNWALRAFGALLESADLEKHFGNSYPEGANYRSGLHQIVDLFLDRQEKRLNELLDRSRKKR